MKPKAKVKIAVDALMTLGLLFLMGYPVSYTHLTLPTTPYV